MKRIAFLTMIACALFAGNLKAQVNYQIDDGTAETTIGIDTAGSYMWGNTFAVDAMGPILTGFEVGFGANVAGDMVDWAVFSDTDGTPDASMTLLASGTHTIVNDDFINNGLLDSIALGSLDASGGSNFFIALEYDLGVFPSAIDNATDGGMPGSEMQSFLQFAVGGSLDVASAADWDGAPLVDGFDNGSGTFVGNWIIRATGVAVPEPTSASLLAFGLVGLVVRRRR